MKPKQYITDPAASTEAEFFKDLRALQDKYPMVYIESWTPDDFESSVTPDDDPEPADWNDPKYVAWVNRLEKRFDAEWGTNWDRLRSEAED